MIDFTEVDFRRTNQTIEGLFDRCQKVIGTNKFDIVINANNKTPLPSTVCITNGQYVIESVLYTFAISSNDNLHITKKTTPEELIDDNHITLKTTWSSSKIASELAGIAKSFTYTGNDLSINNITFPVKPTFILCIYGPFDANNNIQLMPFFYGQPRATAYTVPTDLNAGNGNRSVTLSYNDNVITLEGSNKSRALNLLDETYTVYYI
jgi:hypothetical protein